MPRAVRRAGASDEAIGKAREVLSLVHLRAATDGLLVRASTVAPADLRSLDALHLATALELSPPPAVFLCYDDRLAAAARLHGLTVVAPGVDEVHER